MQILNETALAKQLDLSVHKLRKDRIEKRGLLFYKIGGLVRYNLDNVMNSWRTTQFIENKKSPLGKRLRINKTI